MAFKVLFYIVLALSALRLVLRPDATSVTLLVVEAAFLIGAIIVRSGIAEKIYAEVVTDAAGITVTASNRSNIPLSRVEVRIRAENAQSGRREDFMFPMQLMPKSTQISRIIFDDANGGPTLIANPSASCASREGDALMTLPLGANHVRVTGLRVSDNMGLFTKRIRIGAGRVVYRFPEPARLNLSEAEVAQDRQGESGIVGAEAFLEVDIGLPRGGYMAEQLAEPFFGAVLSLADGFVKKGYRTHISWRWGSGGGGRSTLTHREDAYKVVRHIMRGTGAQFGDESADSTAGHDAAGDFEQMRQIENAGFSAGALVVLDDAVRVIVNDKEFKLGANWADRISQIRMDAANVG